MFPVHETPLFQKGTDRFQTRVLEPNGHGNQCTSGSNPTNTGFKINVKKTYLLDAMLRDLVDFATPFLWSRRHLFGSFFGRFA